MAEEVALSSQSEANGGVHVSFSDVVRAHFTWDMEESGDARDEFDRKLSAFESDAGRVVEAYWCRRAASAVALTRRTVDPPQGLLRAIRRRSGSEFGLYRVTDWATAGVREIPDLLHDCDVLAIKAASSLRGTQQAVVMQWLLAVESHVLGFLERHRDAEVANAEANAFAAREKQELCKIEDY